MEVCGDLFPEYFASFDGVSSKRVSQVQNQSSWRTFHSRFGAPVWLTLMSMVSVGLTWLVNVVSGMVTRLLGICMCCKAEVCASFQCGGIQVLTVAIGVTGSALVLYWRRKQDD